MVEEYPMTWTVVYLIHMLKNTWEISSLMNIKYEIQLQHHVVTDIGAAVTLPILLCIFRSFILVEKDTTISFPKATVLTPF